MMLPDMVPGTVSKVLWHFPGGPEWDLAKNCQTDEAKPASEAYVALLSILTTRSLRLSDHKEVVTVSIPNRPRIRGKLRKLKMARYVRRTLESASVCCLADVPIMHLGYHAKRYGKFAIGFHRDSAIRHGFNPVFYTLRHTAVLRKIYDGFGRLQDLDLSVVRLIFERIQTKIAAAGGAVDLADELTDFQIAAEFVDSSVSAARESIERFLAFIKSFGRDDFGTIYCEREWRAVKQFDFDSGAIAMIVLPKRENNVPYFDPFVSHYAEKLGLPRSVPIVPWEDLVES